MLQIRPYKRNKTFKQVKKVAKFTYDPSIILRAPSLFTSVQKQEVRLVERKSASTRQVRVGHLDILVNRGVYKTGVDTELMIDAVKVKKGEVFAEIGCGTGAISIALAGKAHSGVAVDINELAVQNTIENCELNEIKNLTVIKSDLFANLNDKFDIIICNPPYNEHEVADDIDRMFWDPSNEMKRSFFKQVDNFLNPNGRIYFGWADFSDLKVDLPVAWAAENGFMLVKTYYKTSSCSSFRFLVFEFTRSK